MKIAFIFTFLFFTSCALAQNDIDPIEVFQSHQFPCDTQTTTLETNICLGKKLEFADSLLNLTFHRILRPLDKSIKEDNVKIKALISKTILTDEERSDLKYYTNDLNQNQKTKQAIIKSQKAWIHLRDSNEDAVRTHCEGGTGCYGEVNQSSIYDTIERIKKLRQYFQ
ncbi:MAG: lysozyme inhibitor LprI family protein [Flavisolibacter sp.]